MKPEFSLDTVDAFPWGVIRWNNKYGITYANATARRYLSGTSEDKSISLHNITWVNQQGEPLATDDHPVVKCFETGEKSPGIVLGFSRLSESHITWIEAHCIPEFEVGNPKPVQVVFTFSQAIAPQGANKIISDNAKAITAREGKYIFESEILNRIGQSVIVTDLQGNITYTNDAACKIFGWTTEEFSEKNVLDTTVPDESNVLASTIMKKLVKGESWSGEFNVKRKDGSIFPAFVTDAPIYNEQGEFSGIIGISSDISERKRIENEKYEKDILFQTLIEKSSEAITVVGQNGKAVYVSPTTVDMLGYAVEELCSVHFAEIIHPDDVPSIERVFVEVMQAPGKEVKLLGRQRHKSGKYLWCEGVATNWLNDPVINGIVVNFRDVTVRRQTEEKLKESEEHYRTLFSSMDQGFCIIEKIAPSENKPIDFIYIEANPAFEKHTGLANVVGKTIRQVVPNVEQAIFEIYDKVVQSGQHQNFETYISSLNFWIEAEVMPTERPNQIAVLFSNVSERKQVEESLHKREMLLKEMGRIARIGAWELDCSTMKQVWTDETFAIHDREIGVYDPNSTEELSRFEPGSKELIEKAFEAALLEGRPYDLELEMTTIKGNKKWVRAVCSPVLNSGKVIKLTGTVQDITERKHNDAAMQMALAKYKTLFENFPMGITVSDKNGKIIETNATAEMILGISAEEQKQRQLSGEEWQIIRSDGTPMPSEEYASVRALNEGQKVENVEMGIVNSNKSITWLNVTAAPLALENEGVVVTYHDITDRKLAIKNLLESEQKLKLFVEHAPAAIAMFDPDMKYIAASNRYLKDYDIQDANIVGRSHYDLFPEISEEWKSVHRRCLAGAIEINDEDKFPRANGSVDWVRWEIHPWHQNEGKIGGIILFSELISDRKKAKLDLESSESKFRSIAENLTDVIAITNEHGIITYISPASSHIFGYDSAEMAGRLFDEFLVPEERNRFSEINNENSELNATSQNLLFKALRKNGEQFYAEITSKRMIEDENIKGRLSLIRDVTEIRLSEIRERNRSRILQMLTEEYKLEEILHEIQKSIEDEAPDSICTILLLDSVENKLRSTVPNQLPDFYNQAIDGLKIGLGVGSCGTAAYTRETVSVDNVLTHPYWKPFHDLVKKAQLVSCWSKPVISFSGQVLGTFAIYSRSAKLPNETEIARIDYAANLTRLAIEKKTSEERLRASESKFKAVFDNAPVGISILDNQRNLLESNNMLSHIVRMDEDALVVSEYKSRKYIREDGSVMADSELPSAMAIAEQRAIRNQVVGIVLENGETIWTQVSAAPLGTKNPQYVVITQDISERKQSIDALKESEQHLRRTIETTSDGFWIVDSERRFIEVNEAYCSMSGYDRQELLAMSISDLEAIEIAEETNNRIQKIIVDGGDRFETVHLRKDGSRFDVEVSVNILDAEQGLMICFCRDISQRKRAEKQLKQSEENFRSLFYNSPEGYLLIKDGVYIDCNVASEAIIRGSRSDLIGKTPAMISPEYQPNGKKSIEYAPTLINEAFRLGKKSFEWVHTRMDGFELIAQVNLSIVELSGERIIFTSWQDITERKQAEKQLRESEKRFTTIFEDSPVSIAITRLNDGKIIHVNAALINLLGFGLDEFLGNTTIDLGIWANPDDRKKFVESLNTKQRVKGMETTLRLKSGEIRQALIWGELIELAGEACMMAQVIDITDHKNAEHQLRQREAELNDAQVLAKMANWRINISDYKLYVSDNYRKLIGIEDDSFDITLEYFISRVHPDDVYLMNPESYQIPLDSTPVTTDFRILMADGSFKWFQNSMVGEMSNGELIAIKGSIIDLTEKKMQEEAIKAQNQKLNAILNALPDKLFVHDSQGTFIEAYTTDPGGFIVPMEKFIGKNLHDIFPAEVADLNLKYLSEARGCNQIITHEFSVDYKGKYSHFEVRVVPFMEDKVIRFVRDITERKEIEKQIVKLTKAIEQSPVAIVMTDADAKISYASRAFEEITGYSKEEVLGKNTRILKSGKNDKKLYTKMWDTIIAGEIWEDELINKKKDGSFYWEHLSITPLFEKENQITGYLAVKQDVTEKKKFEQEILELNTSLERKVEERTLDLIKANEDLVKAKEAADDANKAKSIFLANMSHEIRTPLNSIIGFSELLFNSSIDDKKRSQVASIRNSGRSLLNIINDILDLSKVEAGKIVIEREPLNVFKIVNDVVSMFEQKAVAKKLELAIESETDLTTPLLLDETRLRQMLFNLVGNAIKFTAQGGVSVRIRHQEIDDNKVDLQITIADTGIGIPEDQLKAVFEPFVQQQGQAQKTFGGTGLGLAISQRMAEAMGGEILVASEPNKGSEFTICLRGVAKTNVIPKDNENNFGFYSNIRLDGNTILIVDDIKDNRKLLCDTLEPTGARLLEAQNGTEAVELATREKPDLILMDIRMPVMDGQQACKALKRSPATAAIPCIAVTASIKLGNSGKDVPENFDASLMKPVALDQLFEILLKFLKYTRSNNNPEGLSEYQTEIDPDWSDELKQLAKQFLEPLFNHASKTQLIDDIEDFGKQLVIAGQQFENKLLIDIGHKIGEYADLFDVDKLSSTMHEFQLLLNRKL